MAPGVIQPEDVWGSSSTESGDCSPIASSAEEKEGVEPIAIIGFSLKFPGEASSAEGFWEMLEGGRNAMTDFPEDRISLQGHYHPDSSRLDEMPVRGGHFVEEKIDRFDAPFFSITPAEAECMEPQQRGILETSYRALENAGITINQCSNTRTSVHTGSFTDDYRSVLFQDPLDGHTYAASGLSSSMLANRVSWFFNLKGPSINLDTACSSSMTCLHLSCEDLRNRTTDMGIVGGCNLFYHPDYMKIMSNMSFLSPESRSWSLDEKANGYARGEGFGILIVKRLSDAIRDGNTIRAVIRATALNQDGRTPGITVPSGNAHQELIREAYAKGNIDMEPTRFFEAHATGTQAGDPVEANAIGETFSNVRSDDDPLWVGAVKSNVGHLEAGSGMASVLKSVLVLEKGIIPPNSGFENLNKRILADRYHLKIPTESRPWPTRGLRRVCVNSFGFGGSNAVVVLDDAHHYPRSKGMMSHHSTRIQPPTESELNGCKQLDNAAGSRDVMKSIRGLLMWSSMDEHGVKRIQSELQSFFDRHVEALNEEDIKNIGYTLCAHRTNFSWRSFVSFSGVGDLRQKLAQTLPRAKSSEGRNMAFVFTGQGAQYIGMGNDLVVYPAFQGSLHLSQKLLTSMGGDPQLINSMFASEGQSRINEPQYSQPLSTALQIALVDLMNAFGVKPRIVMGHSSGEIAAAYCAGSLSRASALKVAYHRGRLAAKLLEITDCKLSMMAAGVSLEEARAYLYKLDDHFGTGRVDIACINSASNVTLSGDEAQLSFLEKALQDRGKFARKLRVDIAYHSRFMQPIAEEYKNSLGILSGDYAVSGFPQIPMISSVTGDFVSPSEQSEAEYWVRNMTSPVNFLAAISKMAAQSGKQRKVLGAKKNNRNSVKISDIVEIGPHHALKGPVRESLQAAGKEAAISYYSTLSRTSSSAAIDIMSTAGKLFSLGYNVNLLEVNNLPATSRPLRVDLPEYPFQHSRSYWRESRIGKNYRLRDTPRHDFLGVKSSDWNPLQAQWRDLVDEARLPWLQDHKLAGNCLYPAGGMVAMAIEAARQLSEPSKGHVSSYELREMEFLNAFRTVTGDGPIETRFSFSPLSNDPGWSGFQLFANQEGAWIEICHGQIRTHVDQGDSVDHHLHRWSTTGFLEQLDKTKRSIAPKMLYDTFAEVYDAQYGPPFQTLDNITISETGQVMADINTRKWAEVHDPKYVSQHVIHPTTVDGLFQLVFPASLSPGNNTRKTLVPTRVQRLWINARALSSPEIDVIRVMGDCSNRGYRGTSVRARVVSPNTDEPLVEMMNYETTIVATRNMDSADAEVEKRKLCATLRWLPDLDFLAPKDLQGIVGRNEMLSPAEFYDDLHLVIKYFLDDTLKRLQSVNIREIFPSHSQNLLRWMKYQVRECSFGSKDKERRMGEDEAFRKQMIEYTKGFSPEGRVLTTLAESVYQIIRGELDPIQLLFEGTLASDYYQQVIGEGPNIPSLKRYLDLMGHKNPGMKILEIGSGTGSSAEVVTSSLVEDERPRWSRYDYTDVSPGFFANAQKRFAKFSHCMQFRVLDAARDPSEQGFEQYSYDLVIAGNVLHALKDLRETLQNIKKLLKPNGKLILLESTSPGSLRVGLYGGVLKDWWNSIKDETKCSPLLSTEGWNKILQETGFNGLDLVMTDSEDPSISEQSILISSASPQPLPRPFDTLSITCLVDTKRAEQRELADALVTRLSSGDVTCEILDIQSLTSADISKKPCVSLLEVGQPFLANLNKEGFQNLKHLVVNCRSILWVSHADKTPPPPEYAMVNGFARVLRAEQPLQKLVTLAMDPGGPRGSTSENSHTIFNVLSQMLSTEYHETEYEYSQCDGLLNISRVIHSERLNDMTASRSRKTRTTTNDRLGDAPPLELQVESPGLLNTVQFYQVEGADQHPLADDEVVVQAHAFGFTPRDYQIASGLVNEGKTLGFQCSGVIEAAGRSSGCSAGDRVGLVRYSAFRTLLRCNARNVIKLPDGISSAEGASLPVPAMLAVHSLINIARLESEETVFISDAATAAGQILVQLSQSLQARRIFTLVRSEQQRKLLRDIYHIPEHDIFRSKSGLATQAAVLDATDGEGVDVVISSATGDELEASWSLLSSSLGRFVHFGSQDINVSFQANQASGNTSFSRVNFAELLQQDRQNYVHKVLKQTNAIIQDGKLRPPVGIEVFGTEDVEVALRQFQDGKETGNSVLEMTPYSMPKMTLATQPLYRYDGDSTYVIAGGLGGLGRGIARWMVDRGVRHLLLLSRRGLSNPYAQDLVDDLARRGAQVWAPSCDIADLNQLQTVVNEAARTMPPIRGCIQSAMVLRDAVFENMTWDDWVESTRPKVKGSWNLHISMPEGMDFFFFLSSVSTMIGGVSQSNYAAGNAYKDELCHYRNSIGERASVVNFGMLVSEGVVAETEGLLDSLRDMGQMMEISQEEMFAVIEHHCEPRKDIQGRPEEYQTLFGIELPSTMIEKGQEVPEYLLRPLFKHFHYVGSGDNNGSVSSTDIVDYASLISKAGSIEEASAAMVGWLVGKLSGILGLSEGDIDTSKPISAYGVDSLLGMELRNWFERVLGAKIPIFEMLSSSSSMAEVCHIAASRSRFRN